MPPGRQITRAAKAPAFPSLEQAHAQHPSHRHYQGCPHRLCIHKVAWAQLWVELLPVFCFQSPNRMSAPKTEPGLCLHPWPACHAVELPHLEAIWCLGSREINAWPPPDHTALLHHRMSVVWMWSLNFSPHGMSWHPMCSYHKSWPHETAHAGSC